MQATLLHVLHAPAHAHALRGAPGHETAGDELGFSQALTNASGRIDGSLHDAPDSAGARADHGEASPDTDEVPDPAATLAQADLPAGARPAVRLTVEGTAAPATCTVIRND